MSRSLHAQLAASDTILLGRITFEGMARYWQPRAMDKTLSSEETAFAKLMNGHEKFVVSKTMTTAGWTNSRILKGGLVTEVRKLKHQPGKDIIVYGSGMLVCSLMQYDLVDEYCLWVHPVWLGKGQPLIRSLYETIRLQLVCARTFSSGVIMVYYRPGGSGSAKLAENGLIDLLSVD